MDKFDKYITEFANRFINESIVSITRDSLDPTVFSFFDDGRTPVMQEAIKKQILIGVSQIEGIIPVVDFYILGSILTKNYTRNSDIDVNVQIDAEETDNISSAALLNLIKKLNGKYAIGTTHPINYFVISQDYDLDNTEAAYDVQNERWIKMPSYISPDVQSLLMRFQTTIQNADLAAGELRRDLIDLTEIEDLNYEDTRQLHGLIDKKLKQVHDDIDQIVNMYDDVTILRKLAFDRSLTPQEIKRYGHKNRLPENIVYKLLEKYYYIEFMRKLSKLLKDKEQLKRGDIKKVQQAGKQLWDFA